MGQAFRTTFGFTVAALSLGLGAPAARAAEPLPVEAFAAPPRVESVALSPDGKWFASVVHQGDSTFAVTHSVDGDEAARVVIRNDEPDFKVNWVRFVRDDRLVASVGYANRRGWNQITETRLVAVDRDGDHFAALVEPTRWQRNEVVANLQDLVVDWLPEDGHHILLEERNGARDPGRAIFKVDVDTGRRTLAHNEGSQVVNRVTDQAHQPRVSVKQDGTDFTIRVSDPDGEHWRTAWTFKQFSREEVRPLGFGADPNLLYILADHDGRRAAYQVDLRDPALGRKLLLDDPRVDLNGPLLFDPARHEALGLRGGKLWDPDAKALVAAIDAALPGQFNRLLQLSADGSRYLVRTSGNGVPGRFMVGDRKTGKLSLLAEQFPALPRDRMVRKTAFTIQARDGLPLPAFLALPAGASGRGLPMVVLPDGRPIGNDSPDFDPWVEFLTDRGYAVLQVDFRGSAGYGNEHLAAGLKRFGLEMEDDLSDSVKWAVDRGTADPSRICIVGASYGGYAALMAGAKTPELYRCVAAFAGVSDLISLGTSQARFVNGKALYASLVGAPWEDRAQLKETSPRQLATKFQAPVLLVHGTADIRVPFEQSQDMADALKSAGKDVRLVSQPDGDHELSYAAYRVEFLRELDAFLARNLAPRSTALAATTAHP